MPEEEIKIKQKDFSPRYGKRIKKELAKINKKKKSKYMCPKCNRKNVKWQAIGVWACSKCGAKFASDAFKFRG